MPAEKLKIPYPVIVEGKYDRLALLSVMEGTIITTDGFGIFKNKEKRALLRALAEKTPLIILTDPDGAGGVIRSCLQSTLPRGRAYVLHAPRVEGVEKRKPEPSAEGILGVEGTDRDVLRTLLEPFSTGETLRRGEITAAMLMDAGLTGGKGAAERRDAFGAKHGLPPGMNAKAFASALCFLMTREEFEREAACLTEDEK